MNRATVETIYPLSAQQRGILFETLADPGSGLYVEQEVHELRGGIDAVAFERAWQFLAGRHAMLRTAFAWKDQDEPLQVVLNETPLSVGHEDWRHLPRADQAARLDAYLLDDRRRGFDLAKPPLMRLALIQTGPLSHCFVWTQHHILMDGWSRQTLANEFATAYVAYASRREVALAHAPSYGDYVTWLTKQDAAAAERFWRSRLAGFTRPTSLGVPDDTAATSDGERWATTEAMLPAPAMKRLEALARRDRLTLSTIVQGAWAMLLARYSGSSDILFGTTVSGRPTDLPGVETTVGLFVNSLPFRLQAPDGLFASPWLQQLQQDHLDLRRFEYCSTGEIHQWSEVPASMPLYESLLVFENYPTGAPAPAPSSHASRDLAGKSSGARTTYAVTLMAFAGPTMLLRAVYDRRRLDEADVDRMLRHLCALLDAIGTDAARPLGALSASIASDEIPRVRPIARAHSDGRRPRVKPRTVVEETLMEQWRDLLATDDIDVHDNFFDLGGHSLLATQMMARLRAVYHVELPLRLIFESGSIAALGVAIEEALLQEIEALSDEEARRLIAQDGPSPEVL